MKYRDKERGTLHTAIVVGRAGKTKGKYKNWYNLQHIKPSTVAGTTESADTSNVENLLVETSVGDTSATDVIEYVFVTKDVIRASKTTGDKEME